MSDIFISYKREDQPAARALADALENEGWSVWWDPKLRAGERFDDVIERALSDSGCVIVLWSNRSVESRYVRDEATYALNRHKLVPVAIENVSPPFRFEGLHTACLTSWDASDTFSEYQKLVQDLVSILGPPSQRPGKIGFAVKEESRKEEAEGPAEPTSETVAPSTSALGSSPIGSQHTTTPSKNPFVLLESWVLWAYWPAWLAMPILHIAGAYTNTSGNYIGVVSFVLAAAGVFLGTRRHGPLAWFWWSTVIPNMMVVFGRLAGTWVLEFPLYLVIPYFVVGPAIGLWLRARGDPRRSEAQRLNQRAVRHSHRGLRENFVLRSLAVLLILTALFYTAIRFGGLSGRWMVAAPILFAVYVGVMFLFTKPVSRGRRS